MKSGLHKKGVEGIKIANTSDLPKDKVFASEFFGVDYGLIYYKGSKTAIASSLAHGVSREVVGDMAISQNGQWAAYYDPKLDKTFMIDGKAKTKKPLTHGWSFDYHWLPRL